MLQSGRTAWIEISLKAVVDNFKTIQQHVGKNCIAYPVIKSNAYGHGMVECAAKLQSSGAKGFGVAILEEALLLRSQGIKTPIIVMGGVLPRQLENFIINDIDIYASSLEIFSAIELCAKSLNRRARVHLDIDTGMERIGIRHNDTHDIFSLAAKAEYCDIVGISSHFVDCETNMVLTDLQLQRFLDAVQRLSSYGVSIPFRHIAASGAILQASATHLDLVRPGLILYGIAPNLSLKSILNLSPVMSLKAQVVYSKRVLAGMGISYGPIWLAPKDTNIVTIPIGYGDGFTRELASVSFVLIRGKRYPIVGRMCMDQCMVDVGDDEILIGEEVVFIGKQASDEISVEELISRLDDGNAREVTALLNSRLPRFFNS